MHKKYSVSDGSLYYRDLNNLVGNYNCAVPTKIGPPVAQLIHETRW